MILNREENNMIDEIITEIGYKDAIRMFAEELKSSDEERYSLENNEYKIQYRGAERTDRNEYDSIKGLYDYTFDIDEKKNYGLVDSALFDKYLHIIGPELMIKDIIRYLDAKALAELLNHWHSEYEHKHPDCFKCLYHPCSRTAIKKADGLCHIDYVDKKEE